MKIISINENFNQNPLNEDFSFSQLSNEQKDKLYNIFRDSYIKATGNAWSKEKFYSRAYSWKFYGNDTGFVSVRPQRSGLYKLVGVAGNRSGIMSGMNELMSKNYPVWGVVTEDIAKILKLKYGFSSPNKFLTKFILKLIPSEVYGNAHVSYNNDGSITINYSDMGESKKYFIANKQYYDFLKKDLINKASATAKQKLFNLFKNENVEHTFSKINENVEYTFSKINGEMNSDNNIEINNKTNNNYNNKTNINLNNKTNTTTNNTNIDLNNKTNNTITITEDISAGSATFYHRTNVTPEKIARNGFIPGGGAMYGVGLYTTYDLESQFNGSMYKYGQYVIEFQLYNNNKILYLDKREQRKVYGTNLSLYDQLKKIMGGRFNTYYNTNRFIIGELNKKYNELSEDDFTSDVADPLTQTKYFIDYVDGIVFKGRKDGNVLVVYNLKLVKPLRYVRATSRPEKLNWKNLSSKQNQPTPFDDKIVNQNLRDTNLAKYFNAKHNTDQYELIIQYTQYTTNKDNIIYFIRYKNGKKEITDASLKPIKLTFDLIDNTINNNPLRTMYINSIVNPNEETFKNVYSFELANFTLANAKYIDGKGTFIDKNGNFSIEGITEKDVKDRLDAFGKATYFNILNKDKNRNYEYVDDYNYANGNLALAKFNEYTNPNNEISKNFYMLINIKGEPSIDGFTEKEFNDFDEYQRAMYFNTLLKKKQYSGVFDKINNLELFSASPADGDMYSRIFINKEGKPSVGNYSKEEFEKQLNILANNNQIYQPERNIPIYLERYDNTIEYINKHNSK